MGAWAWYRNFLTLILLDLNGFRLVKNTDGANSSEEHLSPPSNLSVEDKGCLTLNWTWSPSKKTLSHRCQLRYTSMINNNDESMERSPYCSRAVAKKQYTNHDTVCLKVKVECVEGNKSYGNSTWTENCTSLSKGDPATSVTNFTCLWYNHEYMNCTWQPGKKAPPNTNYVLYYRFENQISCHQCQEYIYNNQTAIGCHFPKAVVLEEKTFFFMVRDHSEELSPFYYVVSPDSILKLSTPRITNLSKTLDNEIYVSWNNSWAKRKCILLEVEYKGEELNILTNYSVSEDLRLNAPSECFSTVCCTVRMRVKIERLCIESLWSDWSHKKSLGKDCRKKHVSPMIYLLTIPAVLLMSIILLFLLKRLHFLICPPIPDPAKVFKGMLVECNEDWQWTKYSAANVSIKPFKEETCSVLLIETSDSSSSEN